MIDKNKLFWDQLNSNDCLEFIYILQFGLHFSFKTLNLWNLSESNPHKLDNYSEIYGGRIVINYLNNEVRLLNSAKTQHQTRKSSVFQYKESAISCQQRRLRRN